MQGDERRRKLLQMLEQANEPLSGTALARLLGVSRQVIVQDMALLRAQQDVQIISTYQGYIMMKQPLRCKRVFKVRHNESRTQEELQQIVDLGGTVEDVFVYHRVYGVVSGRLDIASRKDISDFMQRLAESSSAPLMQITDDFHYHTVTALDEQTLDQIQKRLKDLGFLAPLREHEPEGVVRK